MSISLEQLSRLLLFVAITFYIGVFGFVSRLLSGGVSYGDFEAAASGNKINQLTILFLLLLSCFILFNNKQITMRHILHLSWGWIILLGFFVISIIWSVEPGVSVRRIIALSSLVVICMTLAMLFRAESLLNYLASSIALIALIGLVYMLLIGKGISFDLSSRGSAMKGIFFDKNAAARVYAYGLILFVGLRRYRRSIDILAIVVLAISLIACASASGLVIALLGIALIISFRIFKGANKRQALARLSVLMMCFVVGAYIVSGLYDYILALLGRDPELTNRAIIWQLITPYIHDNIMLGYGFGAFWASDQVSTFIDRWGFIGNAHSGYLEILLHGGVVCFALLCALLCLHAKHFIQLYMRAVFADFAGVLLALLVVQLVGNYIGYLIINHNNFDMFVLTLCFFVAANLNHRIQAQQYNYARS